MTLNTICESFSLFYRNFLRKRSYRKQCPQQPVKPARVIARTARVRIVSALRVKGLKRTNTSVLLVRIRMKT